MHSALLFFGMSLYLFHGNQGKWSIGHFFFFMSLNLFYFVFFRGTNERYYLLPIQSNDYALEISSYNYEMLVSNDVTCDDFLHSALSSLALVFSSYLHMIIACDVSDHIIVQSELMFNACEVIDIFLLILGL